MAGSFPAIFFATRNAQHDDRAFHLRGEDRLILGALTLSEACG
jgi:hypothetical protein